VNILMLYPKYPTETFWNANRAYRLFLNRRANLPPLGLLTLASYLPDNFQIRFVDRNIAEEEAEDWEWADVVFLSLMAVQEDDYRVCVARAKSRGIPIAIGGPFTHAYPEKATADGDWVCFGEAESIMEELVEDLQEDRRGRQYQGGNTTNMEEAKVPRYDLLKNINDYAGMAIQFSRGCPFKCEFCDIIEIYGRVPRTKTPTQIVAEFSLLKKLGFNGFAFIVDDNFIGNKKKAKEMLVDLAAWNQAQKFPYRIITEASLNLADDDDLLEKMADANFNMVFIGIETPDPELLKATQKMQNVPGNPLEKLQKIRDHGIHILAGFIVGFDNEKPEVFSSQKAFIQASGIGISMMGLLVAIPHTQLSRRLKEEGRLLEDLVLVNQTVEGINFIPKGEMTKREYLEEYSRLIRDLYQPKAFFGRILPGLLSLGKRKAAGAYKSTFSEIIIFLRQLYYLGFKDRGARGLYWKTFFTVLLKNPRAIEVFCVESTYFYHLRRHSSYVEESITRYLNQPSSKDVLDEVWKGKSSQSLAQVISA